MKGVVIQVIIVHKFKSVHSVITQTETSNLNYVILHPHSSINVTAAERPEMVQFSIQRSDNC